MGEQWSLSQEEEEGYRRVLFKKAGKGDPKAKQELAQTYGVRLWSETERAKLVYDNPKYKQPKGHATGTRASEKKRSGNKEGARPSR